MVWYPGEWPARRLTHHVRDRKPWDKAPKWYKQMKQKNFRARVRDAMVKGRELPRLRRSNDWEWI
jgi:hypothetical protein